MLNLLKTYSKIFRKVLKLKYYTKEERIIWVRIYFLIKFRAKERSSSALSDKSLFIKIMHIILFIVTGLYLIESLFLRGLFTNTLIAIINIILGIITIIISIVKKEKILAIIDLAIIIVVSGIFIYLMNL